MSFSSGLSAGEKVTLKNGRPTAHLLLALQQKKPEQFVLEQIIDCPCPSSDNFLHKNLQNICTNIRQPPVDMLDLSLDNFIMCLCLLLR